MIPTYTTQLYDLRIYDMIREETVERIYILIANLQITTYKKAG